MKREILKGQIYYADLGAAFNSEQSGVRPVLVIQNNTGNKYSPTTIVAAITSSQSKAKLPTHVELKADEVEGINKDSIVLCEQIRTIDKKRLREYKGQLDSYTMYEVTAAIQTSLAMF